MASGMPPIDEDEENYEEQYHPRVIAVDIFGNGDIIQKMNEADAVNIENGDDSEESEDQQNSNAERGAPQLTQGNLRNSNIERGDSPLGRAKISHQNNLSGQESPDALTIKRVRAQRDNNESSDGASVFQTNHKLLGGGGLGVPK